MVYDPENQILYWANATEQLRRARRDGARRTVVGISANAVLDERTVEVFVEEARRYAGRFRGELAILNQLSEMSGVDFDPDDQVLHFVNEFGAVLIFWWPIHEDSPFLLHSDLDWEPYEITPETLAEETIGDEITLEFHEILWVAACMKAGALAAAIQADDHDCEEHGDPEDHANIQVEVADRYVLERILDRLETDPTLMARSIEALRRAAELRLELLEELSVLETDPDIVAEAMAFTRETAHATSFAAQRLTLFYLIDRVYIHSPRLPLDEQMDIRWRVPDVEPETVDTEL